MRRRTATLLRRLADRLDPGGQNRAPGFTFTIRQGEGLRIHPWGNQGCPLWYIERDYHNAFVDRHPKGHE